jgi:L-fucose isomerase-like protein
VTAVEQALKFIRAKRQLEETRMLVVAGKETKESKLDRLGMTVRYVPRDRLHTLFERVPVTDEVREVAKHMKRRAKRVVEPNEKDIENAARSFVTAKQLLKDEQCNAITTDCLGMVSSRVVPTPPCMAASIFQDTGVTYGCEADLFAAVTMCLVSYAFDRPGFMQDPVPETYKNHLITAHCTSGTRLKGFQEKPEPLILRSHSESAIGVSAQVLWREGQRVTLARFTDPNALILDSGTVVTNVDTPPAGGCRTNFEIAMDRIEDVRDVQGFHQVVFYGDHRREMEAFCQLYGIKVVNSPRYATLAT